MSVTFSWRASCGKVLLDYERNLFVARLPRKPFTRFCAQPFRGERPAENYHSILRSTFSWRAYRGNLLLVFAPNLFVESVLQKTITRFCALPFRCAVLAERFCSILCLSFSLCGSSGKVLLDFAPNLFAARLPRKPFARFCA